MSVPAGTSESNVLNRATVVPAGTATVTFSVCGPSTGSALLNVPVGADNVPVATVAGMRPAGAAVRVPVKPGSAVTFSEPLVPVPDACAGAAMSSGRIAIWLWTTCLLDRHSSEPRANALAAADVRVNVTWYVTCWPFFTLKLVGDTLTVMPAGALTWTVYLSVVSTPVTVRVIVLLPTRSPMAIFGWLRSLGSMLPKEAHVPLAGSSWDEPHRNRTQSTNPLS